MNVFTRTFSKIFKSSNQQELDKIKPLIIEINSMENSISSLKDGELKMEVLEKNVRNRKKTFDCFVIDCTIL